MLIGQANIHTEEFLQFIWKHRLFEEDKMCGPDGSHLKIITVGQQNRNSGPDFFNARLKIDNLEWAGNVEIHKTSSEWNLHHHNTDSAYDNVILHVVENFDTVVYNSQGEEVPTVEISYDSHLLINYEKLLAAKGWITCSSYFKQIDHDAFRLWFHSLLVERLKMKTEEIAYRLNANKNDWNETFYQFLARNFGFKLNAIPFEMLSKVLPLRILAKHKEDLFQLEALLFGASGLLQEEIIGDDYFIRLRKEYQHLQNKYQLKMIGGHLWKFLRLRPGNFPTVRIAQFAQLIHQSTALFSHLIELRDLSKVERLFYVVASEYWTRHYRFNKTSVKHEKRLGKASFQNIVINTIVPFLFVYGTRHDEPDLKELALDYLEHIPAENNEIIRNWRKLGVKVNSAFDSQALIQLKTQYCLRHKCLQCMIGNQLVREGHET